MDENQFIKKGQEMVHSFANDDEMSRSYISANKGDRVSVFSGNNTMTKEDPVIIDWNVAVNKNDSSYMNRTQYRAMASMNEADDFISKHVSQLDAVSEVDSQTGATPLAGVTQKGRRFA
jgi:hypothetical protein